MAYAAVVSLMHTIYRLLNSSNGSSIREFLQSAYVEIKSLQLVLKRLDDSSRRSKRLNALDGEIKEAVQKLEDSLEFHEFDMLLPEMEEVRQEVSSLVEKVKKMEKEFIKELDRQCLPEEEKDDDYYHDSVNVSSSRDFGVEMVGLANNVSGIKKKLLGVTRLDDFGIFLIVGRAGSGRTIAARIIFEELCISQEKCLDCGAWVNVGPTYEWKQILVTILRQVGDPADGDGGLISAPDSPSEKIKTAHPVNLDSSPELGDDDEKLLLDQLYTRLKGRSYMILLDDVCDLKAWDYLRRSFPKQDNGSLVLLTSSLLEVAKFADSFHISRMPDFDDYAAWELLCLALFGGPPCEPELDEIGKKIVKNCRGLRLVLPKVLLFLSRTKNTPEHWKNIAADEDNPIFMVAHELVLLLAQNNKY